MTYEQHPSRPGHVPAVTPAPVPAPFHGTAGFDDAAVTALTALFRNAVAVGVMYAADGGRTSALRDWTKGQLPAAARELPAFFGLESAHRSLAIGALRAAVDLGYEARRALDAERRGDTPSSAAPEGYQHATLPPHAPWLERLAAECVRHLAVACSMDGLVPIEVERVLSAPGEAPDVAASVVDDEGVHRVRSSYLTDAAGALYQLVVVREGREVAVYQRGCGQTELVPRTGTFTLTELEFVSQAYREILGEFQPLPFLEGPVG